MLAPQTSSFSSHSRSSLSSSSRRRRLQRCARSPRPSAGTHALTRAPTRDTNSAGLPSRPSPSRPACSCSVFWPSSTRTERDSGAFSSAAHSARPTSSTRRVVDAFLHQALRRRARTDRASPFLRSCLSSTGTERQTTDSSSSRSQSLVRFRALLPSQPVLPTRLVALDDPHRVALLLPAAALCLAALLLTTATVTVCYRHFGRGLKYHSAPLAASSRSSANLRLTHSSFRAAQCLAATSSAPNRSSSSNPPWLETPRIPRPRSRRVARQSGTTTTWRRRARCRMPAGTGSG